MILVHISFLHSSYCIRGGKSQNGFVFSEYRFEPKVFTLSFKKTELVKLKGKKKASVLSSVRQYLE